MLPASAPGGRGVREFSGRDLPVTSNPQDPASVKLMVSGATPKYSLPNGTIEVEIPSIALHQVVAVDLA